MTPLEAAKRTRESFILWQERAFYIGNGNYEKVEILSQMLKWLQEKK